MVHRKKPKLGQWLPASDHVDAWVADFASGAARRRKTKPHPVIADARAMIDADPISRMYLSRMIDQAAQEPRAHHLKSVDRMLDLFDRCCQSNGN
jgi:phosphatidylserine decarboxylase